MDPVEDPWADTAASQSSQPASQTDQSTSTSQASLLSAPSTSTARGSRTTPRRLVAQPTRLEVVDDPLGPLGPLGSGSDVDKNRESPLDSPPVPPQKEQLAIRTTLPPVQQPRRAGPADPHHIDEEEEEVDRPSGPRAPPPVPLAMPSPVRSTMLPSVSLEQAAKPSFQITVGDPHKVGDLTTSHVVYSVRTKVSSIYYPES